MIKNDGEFTHIPLFSCLEVKDLETGETIYNESCLRQPIIPEPDREETLKLEQSVDIPEKEGEYRAYLPNRENFRTDFTISDISPEDHEDYEKIEFLGAVSIMYGCILVVVLAALKELVKPTPRKDIKLDY